MSNTGIDIGNRPSQSWPSARQQRLAKRQSIATCMAEAGVEQQLRHRELNQVGRKNKPKGQPRDWHYVTARELVRRRIEQRLGKKPKRFA